MVEYIADSPCAANSSKELDSVAAMYVFVANAVAPLINTPAATVAAVLHVETPFATYVSVTIAAVALPAVATTATAAATTTAAATAQCHQSSPEESVLFTGLLPQYANILFPSNP
jgi:hypothetical protein